MAENKNTQIPWAKDTEVMHDTELDVVLKRGSLKATIDSYGEMSIEHDSRKEIAGEMEFAEEMTADLRAFLKKKRESASTEDWIWAWIKGTPMAPPQEPESLLDWDPEWEEIHRSSNKFKEGGAGHVPATRTIDGWAGTSFEFFHFEGKQGDLEVEGAVIKWPEEAEPEVWIGLFEEFLMSQEKERYDRDSWAHLNLFFENGLLWALDRLDVFENPTLVPDVVADALEKDPDLLYEDIVVKVLPKLDKYSRHFQAAVRGWIQNRQKEAEIARGQSYFWPEKPSDA